VVIGDILNEIYRVNPQSFQANAGALILGDQLATAASPASPR
jgi:hypothetical protein